MDEKLTPAELAAQLHDPTLAAQPGHVYQVWGDGEVTMQKSGPLLWQRTLHQMEPPIDGAPVHSRTCKLPVAEGEEGPWHRSFAFVTREGAYRVRRSIAQLGVLHAQELVSLCEGIIRDERQPGIEDDL